ncbi:MAG: DUF883 family protein [Bauldia sp.]|jgi:ElaB/YqjD/DUF883 family membrane-anchored ribosome-binding protein|nr:DUF883 family protein [Bauldia sp.]
MATAKSTEEASAELNKELQALRDDLASLVGTVKDLAARQAEHAMDSAKETVGHVTERLRMTASEARHRGEEAATEVEHMIASRPLTSVLIALGIGYVIGKLR